jgi:hypothetical protein
MMRPLALLNPRSGSLLALAVCALATSACDVDKVTGRAELFDRTSAALTADAVLAIKGTYGSGCTNRTGAWAVALNDYHFAGNETQLSVVAADVGCALSVTEVKTSASDGFKPATPFLLTAAYRAEGVAFMSNGTGTTQFYANFRLQPDLAFNSDFVLQMVYSDNLRQVDLSTNSGFAVEIATATAVLVPAPNATLSLSAIDIKVDAKNVVKTATGNATLTQGTIVGESYVIDDTLGSAPTYAAVDAAFNNVARTRVVLAGATQSIPVAELKLVGVDLTAPKKRSLIVANIDTGVKSYEIFQITINKP